MIGVMGCNAPGVLGCGEFRSINGGASPDEFMVATASACQRGSVRSSGEMAGSGGRSCSGSAGTGKLRGIETARGIVIAAARSLMWLWQSALAPSRRRPHCAKWVAVFSLPRPLL